MFHVNCSNHQITMTTQTNINIAVIDDHPVYREGVCSVVKGVPNTLLLGCHATGEEFLELADLPLFVPPDILFVDIHLPGIDGIIVTRKVVAKFPKVKVIALTMYSDEYTVQQMFKAGASGYLTKGQPIAEIVNAIETVQRNEIYLSPDMANSIAHKSIQRLDNALDIKEPYSVREISILRMMSADKSNKEIAHTLGLSIRTIEDTRKQISRKMGVSKAGAMVAMAFNLGLLP